MARFPFVLAGLNSAGRIIYQHWNKRPAERLKNSLIFEFYYNIILCVMDKKINVTYIRPTWGCCAYRWAVGVRYNVGEGFAVLETLQKWFNEAEFYWGTGDEYMFLCSKKEGR